MAGATDGADPGTASRAWKNIPRSRSGIRPTCFTAADGSLKCAGRIGSSIFGNTFTTVPGWTDVEQILMSPTFNTEDGNAVCVRQGDGTVWCMGGGYFNQYGQFGVGHTNRAYSF